MVITAFRSDVEHRRATDTRVPPVIARDDRSRDADGHCWDGDTCDHPDHGTYGTVHFIR
jgi:hypothetical protein